MNAVKRMWIVVLGIGAMVAAARGAELAWVELVTSAAPEQAAVFYERTFGWTTERSGQGAWDPVRFSRGGRVVAGVSHRAGERLARARGRWVAYFATSDFAVVEKATLAEGGVVLAAEHSGAAPGARQALLADGQNAVFGVIVRGAGTMEPGRGFWPVMLATDTPAAAKFYRQVWGGDVRQEARTPIFPGDFLLTDGERAWAGVQPASVGGRAGWLVLIGVADIDATVKVARREGARVWREPVVDLIGGRVAVLSDPMGVVFGLYETLPVKPARAETSGETFEVEGLSK